MTRLQSTEICLGKRPALVVVDVTPGFTDPACALGAECAPVVEANRRLLAAFRERKLPVFFTTVVYREAHQASVFRGKIPALNVLAPDSPWVDVDPRLERRPEEPLIEKLWASSFFGTDLHARLQHAGADSLVVTGLSTSGCVRATVVDGLQYNYPVVVPLEAVGDRDVEAHQANLRDMQIKYASVKSLEAVEREIEAAAVA